MCRIDVLAAIVEYVPDLSEKLCVRILAHLMLVAEADLVSLFLLLYYLSFVCFSAILSLLLSFCTLLDFLSRLS